MADIISALNMIMVPLNLLGLVMGVLVGIAFGCMPGLSVNMGLALLFPLAFTFHGIGGILMLLGIYCGAIYGGSISAILLKTPGTRPLLRLLLMAIPWLPSCANRAVLWAYPPWPAPLVAFLVRFVSFC